MEKSKKEFPEKSVEKKKEKAKTNKQKVMQSKIYQKQDQWCNLQVAQNLRTRETETIMSMLGKMLETKA